ncbi:MAG TPA: hypothetical protein VI386_14265 [Candidatus Sulfotelmatobacter sp.]|jgi:hypothetical protein
MGGTGKFEGATGYLDYLGMADFYQNTLILGYLLRALAENGCVLELPYLNNDLVMLSVTRPFSKSI